MGWGGVGALGTSRAFPGEPLRTPGSSHGFNYLLPQLCFIVLNKRPHFQLHTLELTQKAGGQPCFKVHQSGLLGNILITLDELEDGKFNLFCVFTKSLPKYAEKAGDWSP